MGLLDIFKRVDKGRDILQSINNDFGIQSIGDVTPFLIDCTYGNAYHLYETNPILRMVLDKRAEMFCNLKWVHYKGDQVVDKSDIIKKLNNPHGYLSGYEFNKMLIQNWDLYGGFLIYAPKSDFVNAPKSMSFLSLAHTEIVPTGKCNDQSELSGIIKNFQVKSSNGGKDTYKVQQVIFGKDSVQQNSIKPQSKLPSLKYHLSNIMCSLESINVLIQQRGARGILSPESQSGGIVSLSEPEKKELYKKHAETHGLKHGKQSIILTNKAMKWTKITEDVKSLQLLEQMSMSEKKVIDAYGLSSDLFSQEKASTFNNKKNAIKQAYEDSIIPTADRIANILSNHFFDGNDEKIVAEFDLKIFKDEKIKDVKTLKMVADALNAAGDLLTQEEKKNVLNKYLTL